MDYKGLLHRAILLLTFPGKAWKEIAEEEDRRRVLPAFVYPMMGLCGLSVFIGTLLAGDGLAAPVFQRAMTSCCAVFVSLFGGYFLAAYGINQLGMKLFGQEDDVQQAQQLGGYSLVVTFLLDIIVGLFPGFLILSWILQFYLVYVVWEGVRVLVAIADNRQLPYTVMASVLLIACPALIDFVFDKLMNWLD